MPRKVTTRRMATKVETKLVIVKVHFEANFMDHSTRRAKAPELLVTLERRSGRGSLSAQLEHQLRDAVRTGRLRPGTPLPSTRALAAELGISRGLVVAAYAQLGAEGYLQLRPNAPPLVAAATAPQASPRTVAADPSGATTSGRTCRTTRPSRERNG